MRKNSDLKELKMSQKDRISYAKEQTVQTFRRVFVYIFIGVAIGAFIHNWAPKSFIQNTLGDDNPFSIILAVLVGAPMCADIFG